MPALRRPKSGGSPVIFHGRLVTTKRPSRAVPGPWLETVGGQHANKLRGSMLELVDIYGIVIGDVVDRLIGIWGKTLW